MIIQGLTNPVSEGGNFNLRCVYWWRPSNTTSFYKDGVKIVTQNNKEIIIRNMTKGDEGFYKCVDSVTQKESLESWVSVRGNLSRSANTEKMSPEETPTMFSNFNTSAEEKVTPEGRPTVFSEG
ncbi:hypothetical protein Z043-113461 [Arapaima gigas]